MDDSSSYERFTDRARKVIQLANQEAQRFNHEYLGTEHVLLGLVREGSGTASKALNNLNVDLPRIRLEVEKCMKIGPELLPMHQLRQMPRTKIVIEFAIEESRSLNHNYVGTEHLLLGLIREQQGVAGQILTNLGLTLNQSRAQIRDLVGQGIGLSDDI